MAQPLDEYYARGRELTLLSALHGDLHGMSKNHGPASNRSVELKLQYEVFPLIGSTFQGQVEKKVQFFTIGKDQSIFARQ